MIDNLKYNDYDEIFYENENLSHINELFDSLDLDTLITLYFYADILISLSDIDE